MANNNEIRFLNPPTVEVKKKKYCRFKKAGIKYIDYKDPEFLKRFFE
jgi:small subunit ribosomal protein S18